MLPIQKTNKYYARINTVMEGRQHASCINNNQKQTQPISISHNVDPFAVQVFVVNRLLAYDTQHHSITPADEPNNLSHRESLYR